MSDTDKCRWYLHTLWSIADSVFCGRRMWPGNSIPCVLTRFRSVALLGLDIFAFERNGLEGDLRGDREFDIVYSECLDKIASARIKPAVMNLEMQHSP